MRRWTMAAGAAVVLGAVALWVASANLSRFVEANRPRLEETLRAELGRAVATGPVELSLRHGPGVRVRDVRIADDPRFGGDLVRAGEVVVTVRLLPALLGRYQVGSIHVREPVVTLVRDEAGWNVAPRRAPAAALPAVTTTVAEAAPADPPRGPIVPPWPCVVRDGTLRVIDRRAALPRELTLEDVDASVSGAARDRAVAADLSGRIAGTPEAHLRLNGSLGPVRGWAALPQAPLDVAVALRAIDVETVKGVVAMLDLVWPRRLLAAGPVSLEARATGTVAAAALTASLDATPAEVRWRRYLAKPGGLALEAALDGARDGDAFIVRSARLRLGDDQLTGEGMVRGGEPPAIDLRVTGGPASLASLARVAPVAEGLEVTGTGELEATLRGAVARGRSPGVDGTLVLRGVRAVRPGDAPGLRGVGAEELRVQSRLEERQPPPAEQAGRRPGRAGVAGDVRVDVRQGVLVGFNIVEQVLSLGTGIPGVTNLLPRALREARPGLFGTRDARFEELTATVELAGGRRRVRELVFRGDGYSVTGRGAVEPDGRLALTATLLADRALTADVLRAAGPARLLANREGLLELPVRITGRFPDVRIGPGPGLLGRVLERALGGGRQPEASPPQDDGGVVEDALRRLRDLWAR